MFYNTFVNIITKTFGNQNIINQTFRKQMLEGKNKILYESDVKGNLNLYFKETGIGNDFGILKKNMSDILFSLLSNHGVNNHFITSCGIREQKVIALDMLPFIVTVNAFTTQLIAKRFSMPQEMRLPKYLIEMRIKNIDKEFQYLSKDHVLDFQWLDRQSLDYIYEQSFRAMDILSGFFCALNMTLLSIDLRFGKQYIKDGEDFNCFIGDEMSLKNLDLRIDNAIIKEESDIYLKLSERLSL